MPVILTSALLVNVSLIASIFQKVGFPIFGEVQQGKAISGLALWLSTPTGSVIFTNPLRVLFFAIVYLLCCVLFSWLWVEISGLNAREVSKKLYQSGIQIPGFRSSKRQLYKIMKKYIPPLTILGGIFVGLLALPVANVILMPAHIIIYFYELIASLFSKLPFSRAIVGKHSFILLVIYLVIRKLCKI